MKRKVAFGVLLGLVAAAVWARAWIRLPLGPKRPDLAVFTKTVVPGVPLEVVPLRLGHVLAPRCAPAGDASCLSVTRVLHVAYWVKHPRGSFLIDASLSDHAHEELARFPLLTRLALDFTQDHTLKEALLAHGNASVDFVILTHSHWDHAGGLLSLDHPRVVMGPGEEEFVKSFTPSQPPTTNAAHFSGARVETFAWDGPAFENFPRSHDWFGDGSVVLVPLPGHTPGSIGVFLTEVHGRRILFIGDAAWSRDGVELPSHKAAPFSALTDADRDQTSETLWRLHSLRAHDPALWIVPAHDFDAAEAVSTLH